MADKLTIDEAIAKLEAIRGDGNWYVTGLNVEYEWQAKMSFSAPEIAIKVDGESLADRIDSYTRDMRRR